MDFQKYKNNGWGISKLGFSKIFDILLNNNKKNFNCIEFGSGISTEFFIDFAIEHSKDKIINLTSFDNDKKYMYKPTKKYSFLDIKYRELIECDDDHYNRMFNEGLYIKEGFYKKKSLLSTRQKNNFYDIKDGDISGKYDFVLLDGPNGNGRNISFLHLINHITPSSIIFIDDYTHYDFVEKFLHIFNAREIFRNTGGLKNKWNSGGDFIIFEIID